MVHSNLCSAPSDLVHFSCGSGPCQYSKFLDVVLFSLIHVSNRLPIVLRSLFFNVVDLHTYQCTVALLFCSCMLPAIGLSGTSCSRCVKIILKICSNTKIIQKCMHADLDVIYPRKKFYKIIYIFACCTKKQGARVKQSLKCVETQPNFIFLHRSHPFEFFLSKFVNSEHSDYYMCEFFL